MVADWRGYTYPGTSDKIKCTKNRVPKVMASLRSVFFINAGYFEHATQDVNILLDVGFFF